MKKGLPVTPSARGCRFLQGRPRKPVELEPAGAHVDPSSWDRRNVELAAGGPISAQCGDWNFGLSADREFADSAAELTGPAEGAKARRLSMRSGKRR